MTKFFYNISPIVLLSSLLFILPIPHIIAARNIIFYLLFLNILTIYIFNFKEISLEFFKSRIMIIFYMLFFFVLLSSLLSKEILWSLDEFRGQWLTFSLYFITGSFFALLIKNKKINIDNKFFLTIIFYALFSHIIYMCSYAIYVYFSTDMVLHRFGGLISHPTLANYISNILFAFVISELIYRIRTRNYFLKISNFKLIVFSLFIIYSIFLESMRLGMVSLFFMFVMCLFFLFYNNNLSIKNKTIISLLLFFIFLTPFLINLSLDKRWNTLIRTIPIALDTKNNTYWLDSKKMPIFKNGRRVNASNYLRIAFFKVGFDLVMANPFGVGYSRNAFGFAIDQKYKKGRGKHAHSSIVDFTVGSGVISFIFLLLFYFYVLRNAIEKYKDEINFISLLTFFVVSGFLFRSFVDANMRDHTMLIFALLLSTCLIFNFGKNKYEKTKIN